MPIIGAVSPMSAFCTGCKKCTSGPSTGVGETVFVVFGDDDDEVEKLNTQDFAGDGNAFGELDVLMAGSCQEQPSNRQNPSWAKNRINN